MRVFWPKAGVTREHGVAVGWRLGETLCVAAVVEAWPLEPSVHSRVKECLGGASREEGSTLGLPDLEPLALVAHVASPESATNSGFVIKTNEYLPVSFSIPAEVVLFTPTATSMTHFTLGARPRHDNAALTKLEGYGPRSSAEAREKPVDFEALLPCMSVVGRVQAILDGQPLPSQRRWLLSTAIKCFIGTVLARSLRYLDLSYQPISGRLQDVATTWKHWVDHRSLLVAVLLAASKATITLLPFLGLLHLALYCIAQRPGLQRSNGLAREASHGRGVWRPSIILRQLEHRGHRVASLLGGLDQPNSANARNILGSLEVDWWMGIALAYFLQTSPNLTETASIMKSLPSVAFFADPVISALQWLNEWPLGLKLNTPLSEFLASNFAHALVVWRDIATSCTTDMARPAVTALSLAACAGLSFPLALVADCLQLATLHLRLCHSLTATLSRWLMVALARLWDLFRGKRWNVLRKRTDSHAYDVDTLFLGTLLFTLTAFLAPTVLAYAALFASINFASNAAQRILAVAVAALNSVPVFELTERVMRPENVPGGIVFDFAQRSRQAQPILELKSTPRSIGAILGTWLSTMTKT